jgi:hypothetical protein
MISTLAVKADRWKDNNCLVASTSVILRLLLSQYKIPIMYTNPIIHYIDKYNEDTHEPLYDILDISEMYKDFLEETTLLNRLFPVRHVLRSYITNKDEQLVDLKKELDRPTHSNLRVIHFHMKKEKDAVEAVHQYKQWRLVAVQCMKPKHFYSLVKFKEQWYKYDNMNKKNFFESIDEPEHLPCNLKKKFTTVLFYVRDADPDEPICVTLTSRDTLNLGFSAREIEPSPTTTKVPKANHNDVWKYLNDYPNNHPGHVICCFDEYFATTFTSIDEPLRKNELYTAYIYNPAEVVQPKDLFLYKIATRVYRRNICHHDSISNVYNYLKQTIPKKDILVILTDLYLDIPYDESEKKVVFNPDKDDVIDLIDSDDEEVKKKEKPKRKPKSSSKKEKPKEKPKSSAKRKPVQQQVSKSVASVSSDSPDNCVPRVFKKEKALSLASSDTEIEIEENIH